MGSIAEGHGIPDLDGHVVWPWLSGVAGVTPGMAARLLERLDATKASTPSSFWAFCGLATVETADGRRMAQPSRRREETKRLCHAIGSSILRANGGYARAYRDEMKWLRERRKDWPAERIHLTALRKMEKLFLAHLWLVWREALELPVTRPHQDDQRALGPWDMVGAPRRRWVRRPSSTPPRLPGLA